MNEIRIVQYFKLVTANTTHYYQNYFIGESSTFLGESYSFVPFRIEGVTASLSGDNSVLQALFPNTEVSIRLLEQANGNRLSELTLTNAWVNASGQILTNLTDYYIGIGASLSETTIELRYRSAIDSVGNTFPSRTLTRELVGPLPVNSELYLR